MNFNKKLLRKKVISKILARKHTKMYSFKALKKNNLQKTMKKSILLKKKIINTLFKNKSFVYMLKNKKKEKKTSKKRIKRRIRSNQGYPARKKPLKYLPKRKPCAKKYSFKYNSIISLNINLVT